MNDTSGTGIRLYTQQTNPFSEKVAAALALKRLPFERIVSEDPEDVKRWSPIARTLPVLEVDGRRMADSLKIVAWLDELFPEPPLLSSDPTVAAAQRNLADWSDSSFAWYWNRWRAARYPQPGDDRPVEDSLLRRLKESLGLRRGALSRADARELDIVRELYDRLDDLVGFLGDRPFFQSDTPSIADLAVFAMLQILQEGPIPGCREAIAERAALMGFIARMESEIDKARSTTVEKSPAPQR